ncbi:MAG: GTPase ObgE [Planctomycetota bacterium]|nr:GTPase ObgE [Planctomycetota bacterium]
MFIDETDLFVKAGKGGDGVAAFLREKYRPWGGPAGGDGGRGGSVVFEADLHTDTLLTLYRQRKLIAKNGQPGQNKNMSGKSAPDMIVKVPLGTLVTDRASGELLCDLTEPGARFVVARGGKGGRGNQHFATSTHQTPREFELGTEGEERRLHLELKLIADVGLIGLPNAGKSTLLSRISAAHPKIAPYPFTTKEPQLGIVDAGGYRQFVVADLPGLIEGAHAGAGLGDEFLRHVERTSLLVHLVDAAPDDGSDPVANYKLIENELRLYSQVLAERPRLLVANKLDLPEAAANAQRLREETGAEVLEISGYTGARVPEFLQRLVAWVSELKQLRKAGW